MTRENLKELINKELERTHLKYQISCIFDKKIKKPIRTEEFILKELKEFGTRKIKNIELSYEVKNVKFYLGSTTITIDLLIGINDEKIITISDINMFK